MVTRRSGIERKPGKLLLTLDLVSFSFKFVPAVDLREGLKVSLLDRIFKAEEKVWAVHCLHCCVSPTRINVTMALSNQSLVFKAGY